MIKDKLEALQDIKYREFSLRLLPPDTNLIGVRLPVLRKLSMQLTLEELSDDTFEEVMLQGMVIGHIQDFVEFQEACLFFLPKVCNWSICDSFVSSLTITDSYQKEMLEFLKSLRFSPLEYTRRFVLVMLLWYYIESEFLEDVLDILKDISKDGYYVKMACSWLIAELYLKNKKVALAILTDSNYNLDRFIFRKTISKIKDSRKVPLKEKQWLEEFRKKYESVWEREEL